MKHPLAIAAGVALCVAPRLTAAETTPATVAAVAGPREETYYPLETIPLPPEVVLEVGGMCRMPDGRILVGTRRGEIWSYHAGRWTLFAQGLDEIMGLWPVSDRQLVLSQRPELTRVTDTDGDGVADRFENLADQWNYSGHIYEWTFGPVADREGNLYGTLACWFFPSMRIDPNPYSGWEIPPPAFHHPDTRTAWRGWCFQVTPQGEFRPYATGLRSPNGLGFSPEGDLFVSDNQGEYLGACELHHVTRGAFHGHPNGLFWGPEATADPFSVALDDLARRRKPPAIVFPYGVMGQSASQPLWDETQGKFGPFAGQMFIGDQTKATVMRVALHRVEGEIQGACFPFRAGLASGVNRLVFDQDGTLLAGQTDRGWGAIGGKPYALQRIRWTGKVPLEILDLQPRPEGFEVTFTREIAPASCTAADAWGLQHYFYHYHRKYGSPQVDVTPVPVRSVAVAADGRRVMLQTGPLVPGTIYELHLRGVRGAEGDAPLHEAAYYTLNRVPSS